MTNEETWCGNPECPEKPLIVGENDRTPYDQRQRCPVCGSRRRMFAIATHEHAGSMDSATATIHHVRASDNVRASDTASVSLSEVAEVNAVVEITADGVVEPAKPRLVCPGLDLSYGVRVLYAELTDEEDGACLIEVQDMDGNLIVSGVGESTGDALATVFHHMLPSSSEDYLEPDDGMPEHDRD